MISDEFKKLGKQTTELDIIEGKDKTEELKELLLRNLKAIIELMDAAEKLEWSGKYSYCTGWPCCPICHGIKPGYGADEEGNLPVNTDHQEGCEMLALSKFGVSDD